MSKIVASQIDAIEIAQKEDVIRKNIWYVAAHANHELERRINKKTKKNHKIKQRPYSQKAPYIKLPQVDFAILVFFEQYQVSD